MFSVKSTLALLLLFTTTVNASETMNLRGISEELEEGTERQLQSSNMPQYDPNSYEPINCVDPIHFRVATGPWDGKTSSKSSISVSGGGWNKVHCESTSKSLEDGDTFTVQGNKYQVGVGLCIESCELEKGCSVRFTHNCVGFYGDDSWGNMFAADENGKEYRIQGDTSLGTSTTQGIIYNQGDNCVKRVGSSTGMCIPLPDHFAGKPVRAIAQVWNSATAIVV